MVIPLIDMTYDELQTPATTAATPSIYIGPVMAQDYDKAAFDSFRSTVGDANACRVLDHWSGLISEHGLQIKHKLDPMVYASLLENVYLEEWDNNRKESKTRLQGENVRALWGGSVVGYTVSDQVSGRTADIWRESDRCCFIQNRPTLTFYNLAHRGRDFHWVWDLSLPMQDRNGEKFAFGYVWLGPEENP